jgi:hypothetical protein
MIWIQILFDMFVLVGLWALWIGYSTLTKSVYTMGQLIGRLQDGGKESWSVVNPGVHTTMPE